MKVIVVDDEPMARLNIRDSIQDLTDWQIVAEMESAEELNTVIQATSADMVFLDIQMPGMSGLDAAKLVQQLTHPPLVVFVTAYDEFAVQAFELYALDYLLKPFDNQRFSATIKRCTTLLNDDPSPRVEQAARHQHFVEQIPVEKLIIRSTASIRIIEFKDIHWIASCGNYIEIHHAQGTHLHRISLAHILQHLPEREFCRVHRQFVVRIDQARELKSLSENRNQLVLANGDKVSVSQSHRDNFLQRWTNTNLHR